MLCWLTGVYNQIDIMWLAGPEEVLLALYGSIWASFSMKDSVYKLMYRGDEDMVEMGSLDVGMGLFSSLALLRMSWGFIFL